MKVIEYTVAGLAIPDGRAEDLAIKFLEGPKDKIEVSTENFIMAVRVAVAEGSFPHDKVTFVFRGQTLPIGAKGEVDQRSYGFCDHSMLLLDRLIRAKFMKRK